MLAKIIKFLRFTLVTVLILAVVIPMALYITLSTDWAREQLREFGQRQLTELLGTDVSIGAVEYLPFCTLRATDITANDDFGSEALSIGTLDGRFELWDFLLRGKIIIDYAVITDLDLKLYRQTPTSPLNIADIISRLSKKEPDQPPTQFSVRLNDLELSHCSLSYDVRSAELTPGRFNPSHISISGLNADLSAPVISNDEYSVSLRHLSLHEASGLTLKRLACRAKITDKSISLNGLAIELPGTALRFADLSVPIDGFDSIRDIATVSPVSVRLLSGSHISLPDLAPLVPELAKLNYDIAVEADLTGTRDKLTIGRLRLADTGGVVALDMHGSIDGLTHPADATFSDMEFVVTTDRDFCHLLGAVGSGHISPRVMDLITEAGAVDLRGTADGRLRDATVDITLRSALACADVAGKYTLSPDLRDISLDLKADVDSVRLGRILDKPDFNTLSAALTVNAAIAPGSISGDIEADVRHFDFRGYRYRDIKTAAQLNPDKIDAHIVSNDPNARCTVDGTLRRQDHGFAAMASMDIDCFRPDTLRLTHGLGMTFASSINIDTEGYSLYRIKGNLEMSRTLLTDKNGRTLHIDGLSLDLDNTAEQGHLWLDSDYLDANIDGTINFATVRHSLQSMVWKVLPAIAPADWHGAIDEGVEENPVDSRSNVFDFDLSAHNLDQLCEFFGTSTNTPSRLEINGSFDDIEQTAYLAVDMPRLRQGQGPNHIRNTAITALLDGNDGSARLYGTSTIPTKKGVMDIVAMISGSGGDLNTIIDWDIDRDKAINGQIRFLTSFTRDDDDHIGVLVNFEPGQINFGNEVWNINPSIISYTGGTAMVNNFCLNTVDQSITVNGTIGKSMTDMLTIDLNSIRLIEIFETLDIDNAMISGYATGRVYANGLLGESPDINSSQMRIADIGYNYCTIGDAVVDLKLDDHARRFLFDAQITTPQDSISTLNGSIIIPEERLTMNINAHEVKVGFLKPFMAAFTSDVDGYASGQACLSGTFKDLNLEGDIFAKDVRLKIDFTNTWYTATDSLHIKPDTINLRNITLYDKYGKKALLNGYVAHECFHNASFEFDIETNDNFLCYDMTEKLSARWFGTVYGNGKVNVTGHPGIVSIGVRMTTGPGSTFTFVLTDRQDANEYSFISFRDVTPHIDVDPIYTQYVYAEDNPALYSHQQTQSNDSPTAYNLNLNVNVTPQAELIIIMDPGGGDRITAHGSGQMEMTYDSADDDFKLLGKYVVDRGNYFFTLQDIIVREFGIKEGSSIEFNGNPYLANLEIDAYYTVKANLSDLDESFLQDKDFTNTNVPVRTLLHVSGIMTRPSINLGLEFPTLNSDGRRKVMSIVSTGDMINHQILYLLTLGRFYTPEYMASTTKGNELFSMASSTISSQLSSILGKLSDNWSIAPNLRSDRGDFSDIEVDLSLSSSLLNNRLLFNGNFGYRDNTLNNNQFIGDFDIEYLLTPSGTWRFKAYNRYNDQNYYLRTAQTTQGIGLMYRRDFDSIFGRRHRSTEVADSVTVVTADPDSIKSSK